MGDLVKHGKNTVLYCKSSKKPRVGEWGDQWVVSGFERGWSGHESDQGRNPGE